MFEPKYMTWHLATLMLWTQASPWKHLFKMLCFGGEFSEHVSGAKAQVNNKYVDQVKPQARGLCNSLRHYAETDN